MNGRSIPWTSLSVVVAAGCVMLAGAGVGRAGDRAAETYFPPPDSQGGWRQITVPEEVRRVTGLDVAKLDEAFEYIQGASKNGGLLVVRHGWLVYENYYGRGHHEAIANLASCGKSFTSIAMGILMAERPELFPDGLDQKVYTPEYLPASAFPLTDPRKAEITLGQLLAFSAGIRGNNPSYVHGKPVRIDPVGPDGWSATTDLVAVGRKHGADEGGKSTTETLWCEPGGGYSYATSSIHLVSMIVRHVSGEELDVYLQEHLAEPLGWGRWTFAYRHARKDGMDHTPGGGGIALRPTDMLRFGYLLLHEGRWNGRQIVPPEYVRHCRSQSPYNPHYPYSLQFNVNTNGDVPGLPRDAFWKTGSGGHVIYVVPSLDLAVWKLGGRDGQYSERDTGLPVHPEAARHAEPRPGWQRTVDEVAARTRTLELVLAAVVEQ
jgi:CubicO group peptidase (beta-lactamase class C family)